MKKWCIMGILWSCSAVWAQTPVQMIQKFYPKYNQKNQCYQVSITKQIGDYRDYCMKKIKTETRKNAQGQTLMYVLFAGDHFDFQKNEENGAHVHTGLAGMFVLRQKSGKDWRLLAAEPKITVGSSGYAPKEWTFHEFGRDKWGFLTMHADAHQGHSGSHYVILAHDGGQKITESWIGASYNNHNAYGSDCEWYGETADARRSCLANLADLDSQIHIDRTQNQSGFYPLKLTISGESEQKKYHNQTFTVPFHAKQGQYVEPKDYPLKDIEY